MEFMFRLIFGLLFLLSNVKAVDDSEFVLSFDQFYDAVNSQDSYAVVKYYTQWCSHCAKLKPVFEEVRHSYKTKNTALPVVFLNVDCDIFGSTICSQLPGYPIIQFVKPRTEPLEVPVVDWDSLSWWDYIYTTISYRFKDPKWQLDDDRVTEFNGSRDYNTIVNFIDTMIDKHQEELLFDKILDEEYQCNKNEELCKVGKTYVDEKLSKLIGKESIAEERSVLENLIKYNQQEDAATLDQFAFKIRLLNYFESEQKIKAHAKSQGAPEGKDVFTDIKHDEL